MTIGFDAKRAFRNTTGLGNYSRTLISGLMEYYPQHRYVLFTAKEGIDFLRKIPNVTVVQPQQSIHKKLNWYWRSFYLRKEELQAGLNIFHGLSNELPFGKPPPGVKQVVTIHDLIFRRHPEYYPFIDRNIYEMKVSHSCRIADCIITVSEQTKRDLEEWLPFAAEKIKVVHQSCHPVFQQPCAEEELHRVRAKFQLPENYILYVGAIAERKNIASLVKAFKVMNNDHLNLIIVGEGAEYSNRMKDLIRLLGLPGKIRIIPKVDTADLPAFYRMAKLFVYPSEYEGFGIPIIEALFSEVPVVTTKDGCFPEAGGKYTCYADTGDVNDLAEKMKKVLTDRPLREIMITEGKKYALRFRTEEAVKKVMKVYEEL